MINSGKLRHRVELQDFTTTKDSFGEPLKTWTTYAYAWASIEPVSGSETEMVKQVQALSTHKVGIRYRQGVESSHRIKFGCRYLYLTQPPINPEERNVELILMCVEKKS